VRRKSGGFHTPPARPRAGRSSRKPPTGGFLIAHHPRGIFVRMRLGRGRCRLGSLGAGRNARVRCAVGLDCANLRQQERPDPLKGSKAGWRDVTSPTAHVRFDGILGSAQASIACCKAEFKPARRGATSLRLEGRRTYLGHNVSTAAVAVNFNRSRKRDLRVHVASRRDVQAKDGGRCKSPCRAIAPVRMNLIWRAVAGPWATLPAP